MTLHTTRPAGSLDSFSISPATRRRLAETPLLSLARLRKEAEQEVERLLAFLDETDGFTMSECEGENEHLDLCPVRSDWRAA